MSITIEGPTFYDQEDENIFFECLYSLPSFKEVKGYGVELTIIFASEPEEEAIIKLRIPRISTCEKIITFIFIEIKPEKYFM